MSSAVAITAATAEDCTFIARATLYAERAHLDVGIWDVFFAGEDDEAKLRCLASCAETVEQSHLHWQHFLIARSTEDGRQAGSCSRYMAPVSADATYHGLKEVARRLLSWSDAQHEAACRRLSFLTDAASWPDLPIFEGSCYLETVFTEADFRGQGVASALLSRCMADGAQMGASRCFLLAAIGNDGAIRIYSRGGLQRVGQLLHADCQSALGVAGFDIMVMEFLAAAGTAK
jgi:ribosomal protein S18 acetylase RimI-like enzyme